MLAAAVLHEAALNMQLQPAHMHDLGAYKASNTSCLWHVAGQPGAADVAAERDRTSIASLMLPGLQSDAAAWATAFVRIATTCGICNS